MTDPSIGESAPKTGPEGMSPRQARTLRQIILGICLLSLVFIFQPFSLTLYTIGAGTVVLGGLAFNLIPLCEPGRPFRSVVKGAIVVLVILAIVVILAIGSAQLYAVFLRN